MKTIHKIAMIWAVPIFIVMVILMAGKTSISYLLKLIFVKSGTADALSYLFKWLKLFIVKYQWRQIQHDNNPIDFDIRN